MILDQTDPIDQEEDLQRNQYLIYTIDGEELGIEIGIVTEIIAMQQVNMLPEAPDYIVGVIKHRQKIIPLMDLCMRFNQTRTQFTDRTCILVIQTKRFSAGLIVDQITEVLEIDDANIIAPQAEQFAQNRTYITGIAKVGSSEKLLIDYEKLFDDNGSHSIEETK